MTDSPLHIQKREQPGKWASLALTIGVHVVLIAFLVFGIRWQSSPPAAMQVDLVAPPSPVSELEPPTEPPPRPKIEPKPEPKPEPPKPQPKPEPPKPEPKPQAKPEPKPDITTKAQKPEPKKPEPPKPEPKKPEPPKPEPKKPEPPKPEPKKPDTPPKPKAVEPPRDDYMAQRLAQESAQTAARSQMERMMRDDAARAAGARTKAAGDAYSNAIRTKVRGNLLRPPGLTGNPEAVFEVDQLPTGEVLAIRLKRSSGVPSLDDAIERAIRRSSPLPLPKETELFERTLELKFRPLED